MLNEFFTHNYVSIIKTVKTVLAIYNIDETRHIKDENIINNFISEIYLILDSKPKSLIENLIKMDKLFAYIKSTIIFQVKLILYSNNYNNNIFNNLRRNNRISNEEFTEEFAVEDEDKVTTKYDKYKGMYNLIKILNKYVDLTPSKLELYHQLQFTDIEDFIVCAKDSIYHNEFGILYLHYLEGYTIRDLAKYLNVSIGSIHLSIKSTIIKIDKLYDNT